MSNLPETMNPDVAHKLLKVGEAFRIPGPFFLYEEIKMGNVNHTYKVNYIRDDGSGMAKIKSYLVQRVNILCLYFDENLRQKMGKAGRSRVEKYFSKEYFYSQYIAILSKNNDHT